MVTEPARYRPKQYPPPEFPPRRVARFARTPPAVFSVILGAIGLVLALRRGIGAVGAVAFFVVTMAFPAVEPEDGS